MTRWPRDDDSDASNEHKMYARMKTRMMTMIENNDERSNADNNGNSDGNGECIMFSLSTAASILGVSPAHLNRAINLGALPVVEINGARWVGPALSVSTVSAFVPSTSASPRENLTRIVTSSFLTRCGRVAMNLA